MVIDKKAQRNVMTVARHDNRGLLPCLFLLLMLSASFQSTHATCSVCGEYGPSSVPFKDKGLNIVGIPVDTCGAVETIGLALEADSDLCAVIQAVGTACGCRAPPDACSLCWDDSDVTFPSKTLPGYPVEDFIATAIPGVDVNCELLQAFVAHSVRSDDPKCIATQVDTGETCGCPPLPDDLVDPGISNSTDTATNSTVTSPSLSPVAAEKDGNDNNTDPAAESTSCSLCPGGQSPAYPDKVLLLDQVTQTTCGDLAIFASAVAVGTSDCTLFHYFSLYCGCPFPTGERKVCTLCPGGEPVPNPTRKLNWMQTSFVSTQQTAFQASVRAEAITCDLMASAVAVEDSNQLSDLFAMDEALICLAVQMKSSICGCAPDWRQILLTWCYRISALLSLLVSLSKLYRTRTAERVCV